MNRVTVSAMGKKYDIWIGEGILGRAAQYLADFAGRRCVVVTDSNVGPLYGEGMLAQLARAGIDGALATVPAGEGSKALGSLQRLYEACFAHRITRGDFLLALGGGVVGDLTGFAAATYLRGIDYVQAPTTLLAQVDSSVGGKVAVNLPMGKNLAGAFHQPSLVIADVSALDTLDERNLRSGMAEAIKYALIADEALFERLEAKQVARAELVAQCCRIKAGFVQRDPTEKGERMLLNFGHTLAHALERRGGYGALAHGEAVAIGMVAAARWGEMLGITPEGIAGRIQAILRANGLPVRAPIDPAQAVADMMGDKKATRGGVRLALLTAIGRAAPREVGEAELLRLAEALGW